MIKLTYADVDDMTPDLYSKILARLPAERRARAEGYAFEKDKYLSAAAGLLLCLALKERGIDYSSAKICLGEYGKPYIEGKSIKFSLSHSGKIAVCALGDEEVGVDVQKIVSLRAGMAEKICSEAELNALKFIGNEEAAEEIIRLWTAKESAVKYLGLGLSFPLKRVEVSFTPKISARAEGRGRLFLREYDLKGYKLTACCGRDCLPDMLEKISLSRFL